jgi:hypothetical protein
MSLSDYHELLDEATQEPSIRCTECDEEIDVADCHTKKSVHSRVSAHFNTEHPASVADSTKD